MSLVQALSSYKGAAGDLNVQAIATDVQKQLLSADALVRKYGQERLWDSFVRFESKEDVEKKFDNIIQALQALTNRVSRKCYRPYLPGHHFLLAGCSCSACGQVQGLRRAEIICLYSNMLA